MSDNNELLQELALVGFSYGEYRLKGNVASNNKFDLGYEQLVKFPATERKVVSGICALVEKFEPDFIVGVPEGATGLAEQVQLRANSEVSLVKLKKDQETDDFIYESYIDELIVDSLDKGIIIEDVVKGLNSIWKTMQVPKLGAKIFRAVGILDRFDRDSPEDIRLDTGIPVDTLVTMSIPLQLDIQSVLGKQLYDISQNRRI